MTVLLMICISFSVSGQQSMFKALFMFNFAKYIEWPNQETNKEFIIGVYGHDDIVPELIKLAGARKINNKSIVVVSVKSPNEVPNANLFYLPTSKSDKIGEITSFFASKPTLIISDKENLCKSGAGINYTTQGGKMKYEICKHNIISHNLNVDQKLISLGIEVTK